MRWLRPLLAVMLIAVLLLALVANHGCDAKGASPAQTGASQALTE